MISLEDNRLVFRFEDVHPEAECSIEFQRTLRIPDNGRDYPLPAGLGSFDLRHIDDHAGKVPESFLRRGGVIMPMWQAEAMWINFGGGGTRDRRYPFAVKIAAGKINAVTGEPWREGLQTDPQDYIVVPRQPWLDGFCVEKGIIRQFVAMALGEGATVEEQLTGKAEHGGLQIIAYPMKRSAYERYFPRLPIEPNGAPLPSMACLARSAPNMDLGFAAGGKMRQEIYEDTYGLDAWDQRQSSRCFVTLLDAVTWQSVTGAVPHTKPPTPQDYAKAGLPWFDYYAADQKALKGAMTFAGLKTVASFLTSGKSGSGQESKGLPGSVVSLGPDRRPVPQSHIVREPSSW